MARFAPQTGPHVADQQYTPIPPSVNLPIGLGNRYLLGIFLYASTFLGTRDLTRSKICPYPGGVHILAKECP